MTTPSPATGEQQGLKLGEFLFYKDERGSLCCLRHGQEWRRFVGDHAITALFDHALRSETLSPCRLGDAVGLLMKAAAYLEAVNLNPGFLVELDAFIRSIHPLECGPLATCPATASATRRVGRHRLVYNKATKKIDAVSNADGLVVESFDPPEDCA